MLRRTVPLLLAGLLLWTAPAWALTVFGTSTTGASVGGASATTLALPAMAVTAGQFVPVCFKWEGNTTLTGISDTAGNTYTLLTGQQHSSLEPSVRMGYVLSATAHAANVITGTFSGSSPYRRGGAMTFSYTGSMSTDGEAGSTEDNADVTPSSNTLTTAGTDGVLLGCHGDYTVQTFSNETLGNPAVARDFRLTQTDFDMWYKIPTATQTNGTSSLTRGNTERWVQRFAAFKTTGGGGAPPPVVAGPNYWVSKTGSDNNTCPAITSATLPGNLATGSKLTIASAWACMTNGAEQTLTIGPGTYTASWHNLPRKSGLTALQPTTIQGFNGAGSAGCAIAGTCNTTIIKTSTGQSTGGNQGDPGPSHMVLRYLVFDGASEDQSISGATTVRFGGIGTDIFMYDYEIKNSPGHSIFTTPDLSSFHSLRHYIHDGSFDPLGGTTHASVHPFYIEGSNNILEHGVMANFGNGKTTSSAYGAQCYSAISRASNCLIQYNDIRNGDNGLVVNGIGTTIVHNTIHGMINRGIDTGYTGGGGSPSGIVIANNVLYNNVGVAIRCGNQGTSETLTLKNNIILVNGGLTGTSQYTKYPGSTCTNSITSDINTGTITTYTVSTSDFTLKPGSAAIAGGSPVTGLLFNGTADQGAFETFGYSSASINAAVLTVTMGMNLNTPLLPASGITGFTVACSGSNCGTPVVASAARVSGADSAVALTLTGLGGSAVCEAGQTWTVSYSAGTGNVTDSALIGSTLNQPMTAFTTQAVTNLCGGASPSYVFSQGASQFNSAFYLTGTTTAVPLSAVNATTTTIHSGIPFALDLQTNCTIADCPALLGERLFYAITPLATGVKSAFQAVPNVIGTDQIAFYGTTSDPTVVTGATPATCLSGALTPQAGTTLFTADAVPIFDLPQDGCLFNRYVLQVGSAAILGDIYWFEVYNQDGTALSSYTPAGGAKITITPVAGNSAPTGLHEVGAASNTNVQLIWTPIVDPNFQEYRVYQSSTAGVPGVLVQRITATSAAARQSSMTQFMTVLPVAGTYYYTVTWTDTGGQESPVSNEVSVTRTGFAARGVRTP